MATMQTPPEVPWSTPPASGLALVTALAEVKLTYGSKADPCGSGWGPVPAGHKGHFRNGEMFSSHPDQKHQAFECVASTS